MMPMVSMSARRGIPDRPLPWRGIVRWPGRWPGSRGRLGVRARGGVRVGALLIALLAVPGAARGEAAGAGPTTILLVRHAEKAGPTGDVPLSAAGKQRALRLAAMLRDAGIRQVYTTELTRTRETAAPLVAKIGVPSQVVTATAVDALVGKLRKLPAGTTALVVHHSNTLPEIVEKLGGARVPAIADDEFDRLLVLTRWSGGLGVTTLRY
jgi:phosphohistidine phosphatase SixA